MDRPAYLNELEKLARRGEFEEIIARCQARVAELMPHWDQAYPESAMIVECLANAHYDACDYCAAAIEFERALMIHRAHNHLPTDDVIRCQMFLGRTLLWTGRPAESERVLCEALTLLDHMPDDQQLGRGFVLVDLAELHRWKQEFEAAEQLLLRAIKPMAQFGYVNRHSGFLYFHLAIVYECQGRTIAADRTLEKAFRWLRWDIEEDDAEFANALSSRGKVFERRGRHSEARACYREALEILQRIRKPGHPRVERAQMRLAKLEENIATGQWDKGPPGASRPA